MTTRLYLNEEGLRRLRQICLGAVDGAHKRIDVRNGRGAAALRLSSLGEAAPLHFVVRLFFGGIIFWLERGLELALTLGLEC